MNSVLQPVDATINYKRCSACKQTIDVHSLFKTCNRCRAKDKSRREKMRLKKMEIPFVAVSAHTDVPKRKDDDTAVASMQGYQENASNTHRDESQKVVKGVKRKAQKSLFELEGEERKVAMAMMKNSLKQTIRRNGKEPLLNPNVKPIANIQEYQNARSLYDALKSKALSSYPASNDKTQFLQFHGSHSIVTVSSIDNIKRSSLVATDLRKIVRLSFEFASPISSQNDSGSVTLSYPCNCLGHNQGAARPAPQKSNGPGSLVRWASANSNFTHTVDQAAPRTCEGKVSVTVLDDNTHPLDIPGQQIILRVEHPNA